MNVEGGALSCLLTMQFQYQETSHQMNGIFQKHITDLPGLTMRLLPDKPIIS